MRFRQLQLLRFGIFSDKCITFPDGPLDLHLIVGRNEAGKSTARAALSELLFGIDKSTRFAFLHDYSSLRIGATIEQGDSSLYFRRRKGVKRTLLDQAEKALEDNVLVPYLGSSDRHFFERMFSLDQVSLVAGARELLETKDDVGRMLFQASGGLHRLGELHAELDAEADKLWSQRRRKDCEYYVAFDQYESTSQLVETATVRVRDYLKAEECATNTAALAEQAAHEQEEVALTCSRLERIRRVAPGLARRAQLSLELQQLADAPRLPGNAAAILLEAQTHSARSDEECLRIALHKETAENLLAHGKPDDTLLELGATIRQLSERRHELRRFPEDLNKRRAEIDLLLSQSNDIADDLGWPKLTTDELRSRLPSALDQSSFEELLARYDRLLAVSANCQQTLQKRREELAELLAQRDQGHDLGNPELLRHAVEEAQKWGDIDSRRKALAGPAELSKERLLLLLAQLSPWKGNLSALRALTPPSDDQLEGLSLRFERLDKELEHVSSNVRSDSLKLATLKLQETQLIRDAAPVTRQEVKNARAHRDRLWQPLREAAYSQSSAPAKGVTGTADRSQVDAFGAAMLEADALSDRRFDAATASATLQQIQAEVELIQLRLCHFEQQISGFSALRNDLRAELSQLALSTGLVFEQPSQLRRWLGFRRDALELGLDAERNRIALQQHDRDVQLAEQTLRAALVQCNVLSEPSEAGSFSSLLKQATRSLLAYDEGRARQQTLNEQHNKLGKSIAELERQNEEASVSLNLWKRKYEEYLTQFGLAKNLNPTVAKDALLLVREVTAKLAKVSSIQKERLDTMMRDLEQFGASVRQNAAKVSDLVAEHSVLEPFELSQKLEGLLQEHERLAQVRANATHALREVSTALLSANARRSQAEATLRPLYELAQVSDIASLQTQIVRSDQRHAIEQRLETEARVLLESGDGLSLEALEAEASSVDLSTVEIQVKESQSRLTTLASRRKQLDLDHADAERSLSLIHGQADAAAAAAKRNEALAQMTSAIERYVLLRTTCQLLRWSIERFRRDKQDPLLRIGSRMFSEFTLGQFQGLVVEYDDQDKPQLLGQRPDGRLLGVDGMSSGTADQLYLSLRLAALTLHLEQASALPFVADDLFVHFDDERSKAAFRVLAALAKQTQVLFFTHHEHLVSVAQEALGSGLNVIHL